MAEKDFTYEVNDEFSDLNQDNLLKPYGYQRMFDRVLDQHLKNLNIGINVTEKYKLAWVLISLSLEIARPVQGIEKMYAQTWSSQHRRPLFRRDFIFRDGRGDILFKGCAYSVLLDMEKRAIYRKKEIPFFDPDCCVSDFVIDAGSKVKIDPALLQKVEQRRVYNSYIDHLGHVNNVRYSEFAYDTLSDAEVENYRNMKRMDIFFKSEMRVNDVFDMMKSNVRGRIVTRGYNETKSDVSFDIVFGF